MELLAAGYGKRLLISGVHPTNGASDISRSLPDTSRCSAAASISTGPRSTPAATRRKRGAGRSERGLRSLIIVTSNYHMPRAIVELSHAMPDVTLVPFAVVGDKWRDEPWWTSGATLRLLLSEYVKYVAAEVRVRLPCSASTVARDAGSTPAGAGAASGRRRRKPTDRTLDGCRFSCARFSSTCCSTSRWCSRSSSRSRPSCCRAARMLVVAKWWAQSSICADARDLQHPRRISRAREDSEGPADRRLQASVDLGDVRAAAVLRAADLHPQARADMDPVLRLVS